MENEKFYIALENRPFAHEDWCDDYHIEKIFSIDECLEIINSIDTNNILTMQDKRQYTLIITNDDSLIFKYIHAINIDELMMLCGIKDFDKNNTRIKNDFFSHYNRETFDYFLKIKNNEIVSASMSWSYDTCYPYDDGTSVSIERYQGWVENKEFEYFKTPIRYRNHLEDCSVFHLEDITIGNIELFQKLLNINILDIGKEDFPHINWEWKGEFLRYYDKISQKRLYIKQELLNSLIEDYDLEFIVETKLDKNFYIKYYLIKINHQDDDFNDENVN